MKFLKFVFVLLIIVVVIAVIGKLFWFDLTRTNSYSMIPNLVRGDLFLVKTVGLLGRGDVAVCKNPKDPQNFVVLRIVGLPGDTLKFSKQHIRLNGTLIQHEFVDPILYEDSSSEELFEYAVSVALEKLGGDVFRVAFMDHKRGATNRPIVVPDDHFFLIGDNRNMAYDSRNFGPVPIDDCIGEAMIVLWPGEDSGDLIQTTRWLSWLE